MIHRILKGPISQPLMRYANLTNANFFQVKGKYMYFNRAYLDNVSFESAELYNARFYGQIYTFHIHVHIYTFYTKQCLNFQKECKN